MTTKPQNDWRELMQYGALYVVLVYVGRALYFLRNQLEKLNHWTDKMASKYLRDE